MAHPNEDLFRAGYAAFQSGDMDALASKYFAPGIVWHSPGKSPMSGDFKGLEEVLGSFGKTMELTGGNFSVEIHDCVANDDHGVVLATVRGERNGKKLEDKYTHVVHFSDGKVTESWVFGWDQYAVDDFWA